MFVEFEQMPGDARIWIYQADRTFSENEVSEIIDASRSFLTQWTAHGAGLKSSAKVFFNRFLIICVDEKQALASGCSIDASVHFIQALGNKFNTNFFNRTQIVFLRNNELVIESLDNLKKNSSPHQISGDTLTFNNLIQRKEELNSKWVIPVSQSWLNKYFKTQNV